VYWNESGELVVLACEDSFYVLRFNRDAVAAGALATGELAAQIAEEGVETAFDLCHEIPEKLRTGQWCVIVSCLHARLCVGMRVARGSEGALHGLLFSVQEVVVFVSGERWGEQNSSAAARPCMLTPSPWCCAFVNCVNAPGWVTACCTPTARAS